MPASGLNGTRPILRSLKRRSRRLLYYPLTGHPPAASVRERTLLLPKNLQPIHITKGVGFVEEQAAELIELYYAQANEFSTVVGIFGEKALNAISPAKKHRNPDTTKLGIPFLPIDC